MVSLAYLVSSRGHPPAEIERREAIANDVVEADVSMVPVETGPQSVESTVEEAWAGANLLRSLARHESAYDGFFVGCFGEPALRGLRELTDKPVVGSASASFHTAAQLADRFSCLTILDETAPMVRRQVHEMGLEDRFASVRVVDAPVLDIDHESSALVERMRTVGRAAVEEDDAEALVPGCMSLAFSRIHEDVADDLGVPFLDPLTIGLETAQSWVRHGLAASPRTYPEPDREKLAGLR